MVRILIAAMLFLGLCATASADFQGGLSALKQGDYVTAVKEWKPLAEQGDARAQVNLGILYLAGEGVPLDNAEAIKWFSKAAAQGDALAQENLGVMYANGVGVPQDYVSAHMWLNLSSAKLTGTDREYAVTYRDSLASKMPPDQLAEAQRLARDWQPKQKDRTEPLVATTTQQKVTDHAIVAAVKTAAQQGVGPGTKPTRAQVEEYARMLQMIDGKVDRSALALFAATGRTQPLEVKTTPGGYIIFDPITGIIKTGDRSGHTAYSGIHIPGSQQSYRIDANGNVYEE